MELGGKADDATPHFYNVGSFSEGLASVSVPGKRSRSVGFIDKTGRFVIPARFDLANSFSERLAAVVADGKYGYIDHSGQMVIEPRFHRAEYFSEGLAAVEISESWGYVNKSGNFVVDPTRSQGRPGTLNEARDFSGGLARVHIGGELKMVDDSDSYWEDGAWYYINRKGEIVRRIRNDDESGPPY